MSPRLLVAGGSYVYRARPVPGRAVALMLSLAIDTAFGEPPAWAHPVVWIGKLVAGLERLAPAGDAPRLAYGALVTLLTVGGAALFGALVGRVQGRLPRLPALLLEAWLLKTMLSVRALLEAGKRVDACLDRGDLDGAREAVRALVSRDPAGLDQRLLTSAAVESLAENTSDSVVAPLFYYALGGLTAVGAYRAANTLDAMIGYRGEYEHLGKVAARLDDLFNLVPARLTSALLLAGGAVGGGDLGTGFAITLRDHGRTASPNAGWPMSTMAGLLAIHLEKPRHYELGIGLPPPDLPAIDHAAELVKATSGMTLLAMLGLGWIIRGIIAREGTLRRGTR